MSHSAESIAIVGIGCRMPGDVRSPAQLWELLVGGMDAVSTVPPDRWNKEEFYDPNPNKAGKIETGRGGFIGGIDLFDNEFFSIFPKEAERIDPQQRFLLMATYEAVEDSGDTLDAFRGTDTAVIIGSFMNDYQDIQVDPSIRHYVSPHVAMGSSLTSLSNRISYLYDLHGPSVTIDTACSSSLVSVHLACQTLWRGEASAAVAGGVNIMINPLSTVILSKGNFLSPDGRCKTFDESANGYVRSEGVGVVYLKPLSKALEDGNEIYGLIRGTACNSDGFTPEGYTVPSESAQTAMLRKVYGDAGIDVKRVQYIEAHGTGTPVGDPIETKAFANVFGDRPADAPLLIGAVKSNIGHMEGAAGVAGLIKLSLSLRNKTVPGNLHFHKVNPKIDLENWRLRVVSETMAWPAPADGGPRIGGVNCFGAGGTNAHLALEEYRSEEALSPSEQEASERLHLFAIGAQTEEALSAMLREHQAYLECSDASLRDICFSAGRYRSGMRHRTAIVAADKAELIQKIDAILNGTAVAGVEQGVCVAGKPKLAFVFTGQGPQWYAMGRELIEAEPRFREIVQQIEAHFVRIAGWSLLEELSRSEAESRVSDTRIAQPAIMAIQIALVELWRKHGVEPEGVVGHSLGEVAAAYTAGALTLEQAVQVIFHRSRGQHAATGKGKMLAIGVSLPEAEELIDLVRDRVSIGAVNGPQSITLSGDEEALLEIARQLEAREIFNRFLAINVPFHSHHMEPLKDELIASLRDLVPTEARLPLYSTVTRRRETGRHLVTEYWYANARDPVYFSPTLREMIRDGYDHFIEIGPHPALSGGAEELFGTMGVDARIYPSIRRKEPEKARFLQTLGALFCRGHALDWDRIYPGARRVSDLPRYPWQLRSFWFETSAHRQHRLGKKTHPLLVEHRNSGLGADNHAFDLWLDRHTDPYLDDHRVNDIIIFPAAGHLEIASAAARKAFGDRFAFLEDVNFELGLFLPEDGEAPEIRLEVFSDENRYVIMSRERGMEAVEWTRHSNGRMNTLGDAFHSRPLDLESLKARIDDRLPVQPLYNELRQSGLFYGTTFRAIEALWTAKGEILGRIATHDSLKQGLSDYLLHPSVLDACLQTIFAGRMAGEDGDRGIYLPVHIDRYRWHCRPRGEKLWSYVRVTEASAQFLNGDFWVMDEDGSLLAEVQGLSLKYLEGSRKSDADLGYGGCYEYVWQKADDLNLKHAPHTTLLLIADDQFDTLYLKSSLAERGVKLLQMGPFAEADYQVVLDDRDSVLAGMRRLRSEAPEVNKIVVSLPLSVQGTASLEVDTLGLGYRLVNLFNAVVETEFHACLWIVTESSDEVDGTEQRIELAQSPVYGVARVLNNEFPQAVAKIADLGSAASAQERARLCEVISSTSNGGNETEFAFRGDKLYVKRLQPVARDAAQQGAAVEMDGAGSPYEAFFREPGILDSVSFRQIRESPLTENEIEIDIHAAGLNFKDVLNGMGLLTAESVAGGLVGAQLGSECSGVVRRVGAGVRRFNPGDEVLAIAPRSLAGRARTPEHCVVKKPTHLSFPEAATLTIVYLTAYHCLVDLARLEEGERVLVHSGTGGVGIAATRLAQLIGAEVFATAGSDAKRELLREMGVRHVYDSRKLDFYDQVMGDTQGDGVDVVLNSLSGKAVVQNIKCLAPFGRFVEIGKTDIYNDASLYLKRFGDNLSYFAVDVDRLMGQKPERAAKLFGEVIALFEKRKLEPHPFTVFGIDDLPAALDHLAKGMHIGKVVATMSGRKVTALPPAKLGLRPDRFYVVTGGASGFGVELAKWLVEKGARRLSLVSRSGLKTEYDRRWIAHLRDRGVEVRLDCIDIAAAAEVRELIADLRRQGGVAGVIHGAAIMQDATIQHTDIDLFARVFEPKALGAWNLHLALGDEPLEFFLMLSSISAVFGMPGQSNYSSANNFLDKLALFRRHAGLTAQSVDLGILGQYAGLSREAAGIMNILESQGWQFLSLRQILAKLENILLDGNVVRMAAGLDWVRFREFFPHLRSDLKFAHLMSEEALNLKGTNSTGESLKEKVQALAAGESLNFLLAQVKEALARILGMTVDKIDEAKSISAIGLDSLMMNQLRNWIQQKLEVNYPLMRMVKGPSLLELCGHIIDDFAKSGAAVAIADSSGVGADEDLELLDGWFVHRKSSTGSADRLKLFMFHSMGAGASMFGHFLFHPPAACDVHCIQLPGRENRNSEHIYTELPKLLDDLQRAILPHLDGPFAFYGHSFGGIIAFELARRLRRHSLTPKYFFCSATMAPQLTMAWKNRDVMHASTISSNSEQKLIGLMSYIDDLDFVKKILPGMRRDMPLLMGYDYQEEDPLDCPIMVFSAIEDEVTMPEEMAAWKAQTSRAFCQEMVHGDHWFVSRNKDFIGRRIAEALKVPEVSPV